MGAQRDNATASTRENPHPEGVEDYGTFQRRVWLIQRCAWIAFVLVLVACLSGFLGRGGPFSRESITFSQGNIEIPIISRWNAPDEIRVTFYPSAEERHLVLDSRFFDPFSVEGIDPPQQSTRFQNGRVDYVFPPDPLRASVAVFRLRTEQPWLHTFEIGLGNESRQHSIFVFP